MPRSSEYADLLLPGVRVMFGLNTRNTSIDTPSSTICDVTVTHNAIGGTL